jgi:quercetin dioxygenase-like cupin family protein
VRTTVFHESGGRVRPEVKRSPDWQLFEEYEGKPLDNVRLVELLTPSGAEIQLVEIGAGGHFDMHSSPDVAFCQIVRGKGKLGLPGAQDLDYEGPELFVFLPNTLHDWHDVAEDTLLSVCLVKQ